MARATRPKAAEVVANWLRRPIISGDMSEGDPFPNESKLSEELGVSRPTIREAMRILESEGLVEVRRGIGGGARAKRPRAAAVARSAGFVLQQRGATVGDVFRTRELLEVPALELAMQRDDRTSVLNDLEDALKLERAALSGSDSRVPAGAFHRALIRAAGSPTLELYAAITNQIIFTHTSNFLSERESPAEADAISASAHQAHSRLVDLLRKRDITAASKHWREHLSSSSEVLTTEHDMPVSLLDRPLDPRLLF